ncbi:hypothetical protein PSTT_09971 [Puccinia striiformis]|uniref:Uncharacterized protein n=1 Tax=Puccinia striiformis TaxID=27350 RepID=A0A2S4V653_9BASI|nr:hypothetical protein PSTT_09971 [Puccinia striiformis]
MPPISFICPIFFTDFKLQFPWPSSLTAEFDWKKFLAVTTLVNALGKFVEKIPPFLEKHSGTVATFFAGHLAKTSPGKFSIHQSLIHFLQIHLSSLEDTAMWALLVHKLLAPQQAKFTEQQMTALRRLDRKFLKLSLNLLPGAAIDHDHSQTPFKHYLNSCHIFLLLRKHFKNNAEILEENFGAIFSEDGHQLQAHISLRSGSSRSSSRTAYSRRFTSIKMNEDFVYDSADDTKIEEEKGNMIVKVETNKSKLHTPSYSPSCFHRRELQLPAVWKQIRLVSSRKLFPPIRCSHPSVELIGLQQTARCLISDNFGARLPAR